MTSPKASTSAYGSPISLEATSRFKSLLASGNRYRKMSTAAELLKQAHQLHSLQLKSSASALQEPVHSAACQQQQHNLHKAFARQQQQQSAGLGREAGTAVSSQKAAAGQEQSHPEAVDHAAAAEKDMASVALDVVESQLPQWTNRNTLDWSAQKELSFYQPQVRLPPLCLFVLILTCADFHNRTSCIELLWAVHIELSANAPVCWICKILSCVLHLVCMFHIMICICLSVILAYMLHLICLTLTCNVSS